MDNEKSKSQSRFVENDGEFLVIYPLTCETFRTSFDDAANSTCKTKNTSEKGRNMRETQVVQSSRTLAHKITRTTW
jgi:hypothetical protein